MSIYKRGKTWWIQFTDPNGKRIQQSARTKIKKEAQELHDNLKAQAWRVKSLGDKPRYTWKEVVIKWMSNQEHRKSPNDDKKYLLWLHPYLEHKYLDEIDKQFIEYLKIEKLKTGVSNSTVNHVLAFLRSVLNRAKNEWEYIDHVPFIKMLPVERKRIRWITQLESKRLLKQLPDHLNLMVRFTLATGLRESNVTHLEWSQIDIKKRCVFVYADQIKNNKDLVVPLNNEALAVIREQIGKHQVRVFTYKGQPIEKANTRAWREALKRAGINNFRWHDLRHTWASWHIQNGTPLEVLKELGGWSDLQMVLRYAHQSSERLQQFAENVESNKISNVTKLLQSKD